MRVQPATRPLRLRRLPVLLIVPLLAFCACALGPFPVGGSTSSTHLAIVLRVDSPYVPYSTKLGYSVSAFTYVVKCQSGEQVIGGGYTGNVSTAPVLYNILESDVDVAHNGWHIVAYLLPGAVEAIDHSETHPPLLYLYALCLSGAPSTNGTASAHMVTYLQSDPTTVKGVDAPHVTTQTAKTSSCPSGSVLTDGGYAIQPITVDGVPPFYPQAAWVSASQPTEEQGWQVTTAFATTALTSFDWAHGSGNPGSLQMTASAVCVTGLTATSSDPVSLQFKGTDFTAAEHFFCSSGSTPAPTDDCDFYHVIKAQTPVCPAHAVATGGAFDLEVNPLYLAQQAGPSVVLNAPESFPDPSGDTFSLAAQIQLSYEYSLTPSLDWLASGTLHAICVSTA